MTTEDYRKCFFHTSKGVKVNIDDEYIVSKLSGISEEKFLIFLSWVEDTCPIPFCVSYIAFFVSVFMNLDIGLIYSMPVVAFIVSGLLLFLPYTIIHFFVITPVLGKLYNLTGHFFLHPLIVLIVSLVLFRPILFLVYLGILVTCYGIYMVIGVFLYKVTAKVNTYSFSVNEIICFNWLKYFSKDHKCLFSVISEYKKYMQNKSENPDSYTDTANISSRPPMKWYKFLVFVYLPLVAISYFLSGIFYTSGLAWKWCGFTEYQFLGVIIGVMCLIIAALSVVTMNLLYGYKKDAPIFLYTLYALWILSYLILFVSMCIIFNINASNFEDYSEFIAGLFTSLSNYIIFIPANVVYFKKRSNLFCK